MSQHPRYSLISTWIPRLGPTCLVAALSSGLPGGSELRGAPGSSVGRLCLPGLQEGEVTAGQLRGSCDHSNLNAKVCVCVCAVCAHFVKYFIRFLKESGIPNRRVVMELELPMTLSVHFLHEHVSFLCVRMVAVHGDSSVVI